jgi:parallel beta-helix repeat protein
MNAQHALVILAISIVLGSASNAAERGDSKKGRVFYVRQTIGNDSYNGLSPQSAWASLSKLEEVMMAGDTVYVGPGLYREMVTVANSGTAEAWITFVGDTTGQRTGDPPGTVMVTGADPMDETVFVAQSTAGVYMASELQGHSLRAVEMDGLQYRYKNAMDTAEHIREGMPELEVVARMASTFHYDREAGTLYIHTSDGLPPSSHEIELIRRPFGIVTYGNHYVSVTGFTFRHMGTAGINFGKGSSDCLARDNTSYGSWQGIRISDSSNIRVEGNTLFRNGNSGIYFFYGSTHGHAIGNVAYENAKGVRWSSNSANGVALDNVTFDNQEVGIAIESTDDIHVSNNIMVNNKISQLLVSKSRYTSQANCYESGGAEQLIAKVDFYESYKSLAEFQQATNQDLDSREKCGQLPPKIDVHKLHTETTGYAERARRILTESGEREEKPSQAAQGAGGFGPTTITKS